MSRRRRAEVRKISPDTKFNNEVVAKFINCLMKQGRKSVAEKIFYQSIDAFSEKVGSGDPMGNFLLALDKVKPELEVRSRRVGGSTYQIPVEVRDSRKVALAIRWLITYARARNGKSMAEKLTAELYDAFSQRGSAYKKKEDTHKMAEANRAFAHYIW